VDVMKMEGFRIHTSLRHTVTGRNGFEIICLSSAVVLIGMSSQKITDLYNKKDE